MRWTEGEQSKALSVHGRLALERALRKALSLARDVVGQWAELITNRALLDRHFAQGSDGFSPGELERVQLWCGARVSEVLASLESRGEARDARRQRAAMDSEKDSEAEDAEDLSRAQGVDGRDVDEGTRLDLEDDTLLLRLSQRLRGPLTRGTTGKEALIYEHVLVDEAQDLSPVELATVLGTVTPARSITLAGDVQQRLLMDNGFSNWKDVLSELGFAHIEIEPLKLSYRSTQEIIDLSRAVLGPLASADEPVAVRHGAPVELFSFAHAGDSMAFLAEALRDLMNSEPSASVAVIARYPEQADVYFQGLQRAEVANLRRVAEQDFSFRPGVDVTDVRQVKGLEFDYVIVVEATEPSYPLEDEARHLLHIATTRAAHQLWLLCPGRPSPLLPTELIDRGQ